MGARRSTASEPSCGVPAAPEGRDPDSRSGAGWHRASWRAWPRAAAARIAHSRHSLGSAGADRQPRRITCPGPASGLHEQVTSGCCAAAATACGPVRQ